MVDFATLTSALSGVIAKAENPADVGRNLMSKTDFVSVVLDLLDAGLLPELRCTLIAGCSCGWTSPMVVDLPAVSVLAVLLSRTSFVEMLLVWT